MVFCTQCGTKASDKSRFCAKCGNPITPPTEIDEQELEHEKPVQEQHTPNKTESNFSYNGGDVDRKTLFDNGMLVLTSKYVILYTSDERDELKRIPISSIESCSYSSIRRGLLVKRRVNEDNMLDLPLQKQIHRSDIKSKKEVFKLPKDFESNHTHREEFRIWEYAINRRISGMSQLKINTVPYDAVVTLNRRVMGTTPLTLDIPLIDEAILYGKYQVTVMKEGYDIASFSISAEYGKRSILEEFELYEKKNPDLQLDQMIADMRKSVSDRSIDLSYYDIEKEIEGENEVLLMTQDEILVLSKNKEQYLFEIPYGAILESKYARGLLRRNNAVKIVYNEKNFENLAIEFHLDDRNGEISPSEMRQRSESLIEFLDRKKKSSKTYGLTKRMRSPDYFVLTENDIQNNFSRFEPFEFERLIAKLFEKKGYRTTVTSKEGDFGVDVFAEAGNEKVVIQVKHWQVSVGGPDVHKTLGSMITFGANRAMVVTSSDFTSQAYEIQKRGAPVELWNGSRLRDEFKRYLLDAINEARNSSGPSH